MELASLLNIFLFMALSIQEKYKFKNFPNTEQYLKTVFVFRCLKI